jgi:hypothetical protein
MEPKIDRVRGTALFCAAWIAFEGEDSLSRSDLSRFAQEWRRSASAAGMPEKVIKSKFSMPVL